MADSVLLMLDIPSTILDMQFVGRIVLDSVVNSVGSTDRFQSELLVAFN